MMSHKPMVGAWSQVPHGGQGGGKSREMLELPSAALPPSVVGITNFGGCRHPHPAKGRTGAL